MSCALCPHTCVYVSFKRFKALSSLIRFEIPSRMARVRRSQIQSAGYFAHIETEDWLVQSKIEESKDEEIAETLLSQQFSVNDSHAWLISNSKMRINRRQ